VPAAARRRAVLLRFPWLSVMPLATAPRYQALISASCSPESRVWPAARAAVAAALAWMSRSAMDRAQTCSSGSKVYRSRKSLRLWALCRHIGIMPITPIPRLCRYGGGPPLVMGAMALSYCNRDVVTVRLL
jgi:hypothetical protein